MHRNQFALLGTRRFLPLLITQLLGAFNDNLFKNALVILITYVLAERSGLDARVLVVLAGGILIFPFFLFSATAGQLADKYDKARLARYIKLAEIVIMLAAGVGFWLGSVTLLMGVLFLMGAQSAFLGPSSSASCRTTWRITSCGGQCPDRPAPSWPSWADPGWTGDPG
jgi:acyl-[acyl-carrier-protein]-phospholipid O-acyltransferase/long-chain-fatty-acid--[acyl-carrier-protein] ligase